MSPRQTAAALVAVTVLAAPTAPAMADDAEHGLFITYNGAIMGLRVMKASVRADMDAGAYSAESAFRSAGVAGLFKTSKVWSSVAGARREDAFSPRDYRHVEISGRKRREVALSYGENDVVVEVNPPFGDPGSPPPTEHHRREALDPVSAILAIAMPNGEAPCDRRIRIFDSKLRYDLVFSDAGKEEIRTRGYRGPAYKCRTQYVPIAGFDPDDLTDNAEVYRTPIYVWLADMGDGLTAPVRIAARFRAGPLRIGVEVEATRIEFAPHKAG